MVEPWGHLWEERFTMSPVRGEIYSVTCERRFTMSGCAQKDGEDIVRICTLNCTRVLITLGFCYWECLSLPGWNFYSFVLWEAEYSASVKTGVSCDKETDLTKKRGKKTHKPLVGLVNKWEGRGQKGTQLLSSFASLRSAYYTRKEKKEKTQQQNTPCIN